MIWRKHREPEPEPIAREEDIPEALLQRYASTWKGFTALDIATAEPPFAIRDILWTVGRTGDQNSLVRFAADCVARVAPLTNDPRAADVVNWLGLWADFPDDRDSAFVQLSGLLESLDGPSKTLYVGPALAARHILTVATHAAVRRRYSPVEGESYRKVSSPDAAAKSAIRAAELLLSAMQAAAIRDATVDNVPLSDERRREVFTKATANEIAAQRAAIVTILRQENAQ
jgi:hypothetical protein